MRACMCVSEERRRRAAIYWIKKRASNGFMFDEINVSTRSDFFNLEIRRGRDDLQQYSSLLFLFLSSFRSSKNHTRAQQRVTFIKIFSDHYSFPSPPLPETRFISLSLLSLSLLHILTLLSPPYRTSKFLYSVYGLTFENSLKPFFSSVALDSSSSRTHTYIYIYIKCVLHCVYVYGIPSGIESVDCRGGGFRG